VPLTFIHLTLFVNNNNRYNLIVQLGKDGLEEYTSNRFKVDNGGYGVIFPNSGGNVYSDEWNRFAWKSDSYRYFSEDGENLRVNNVTIFLFGAETDCTISPLVNSIAQLFDPSYGCEESWVQVGESIYNTGFKELMVPSHTLDGKEMRDFDEVYTSIIGVDNTNVFSRNRGSFKVFNGCPAQKRYELTFDLHGKSSLNNYYATGKNFCTECTDVQTGWYFELSVDNVRDDRKTTHKLVQGSGHEVYVGQASEP